MPTLIQEIDSRIQAWKNCKESGNTLWEERHAAVLIHIARNLLPSGSGIDSGTAIEWEGSSRHKIILQASYHHMNNAGYYDGWTEHTIKITPAFKGIDIQISGRNRNDIKEYLSEVYHNCLTTELHPNTIEKLWAISREVIA